MISAVSKTLLTAVVGLILFATPLETIHAQQESKDNEESSWTVSPHGKYMNKENSRGVDLSNDLATFQYGVRVEHSSGVSLDVGGANLLGSGGGFERWEIALGYTYTATSWMVFSGALSQFKYQDDSLNAIANLTNSLTLGVSFPSKFVNVGLSYNSYFGGGSASYFGLSFDRSFQQEKLTVNPSLNFSFISQTIDQKRLVSYKKNVKAAGKGGGNGGGTVSSTSVMITGLSGMTLAVGLSYDLGSGFTVDAQPMYVYSPRAELAANTGEFLWSVGLTFSRDL
jgi:hypothetical protein